MTLTATNQPEPNFGFSIGLAVHNGLGRFSGCERIPLLPRNCKSYERCTYVTVGATLMGRRSD